MPTIRIPTPLRAYTANQAEVQVSGATVAEALDALTTLYPDLQPHLFADGRLRSFVNIFLGDEDIRFLGGVDTALTDSSHLRIIPTIAGGQPAVVDAALLRFGGGATIVLLLAAFVLDAPLLVLLVAMAQLMGGLGLPYAPYRLVYQALVQRRLLTPRPVTEHPQPHRFAMLVGAACNAVGGLLLVAGSGLGWVLVWVVIALANLNFWLNFCMGCWMYLQFSRLGVPGFTQVKD